MRLTFATSTLVLSALLAAAPASAQNRNGPPTNESTPAEREQTRALNGQIQQNNAAAQAQYESDVAATNAKAAADNAAYQAQRQQYQDQLQQNQAAQRDYTQRTTQYYTLRSRYAAERAAYRRAVWPARYRDGRLASDARLEGSRVEIVSGARVGTVNWVARKPGGRVDALYVTLDNGKQVWIDEGDIRFNRASGVVVTNLERMDLYRMADQRF